MSPVLLRNNNSRTQGRAVVYAGTALPGARCTIADHLLFVATLVYVCLNWSVHRWFCVAGFYLIHSACIDAFTAYERFYISVSLEYVEAHVQQTAMFCATHLMLVGEKTTMSGFLLRTAKVILLSEFDVAAQLAEYVSLAKQNPGAFLQLVIHVLACCATQALLFKVLQTNTKRKIFHFCTFLTFFYRNELLIRSGQLMLFAFALGTNNAAMERLFAKFRSRRDRGTSTYSHVLLLCSVLYSAMVFRDERDYHCVLIALCFLDSLASITGRFFGAKEKSLKGLCGGYIAGNAAYYLVYGDFSQWAYFMHVSLIEYLTHANDNITLPFFSVYLLGNAQSTTTCARAPHWRAVYAPIFRKI